MLQSRQKMQLFCYTIHPDKIGHGSSHWKNPKSHRHSSIIPLSVRGLVEFVRLKYTIGSLFRPGHMFSGLCSYSGH
jgi:hypothetical protein